MLVRSFETESRILPGSELEFGARLDADHPQLRCDVHSFSYNGAMKFVCVAAAHREYPGSSMGFGACIVYSSDRLRGFSSTIYLTDTANRFF